MSDSLSSRQFALYRGEGSHDRPSYYPKTGRDSNMAGAWWTSDLESARGYARSAKGTSVYKIDVDPSEAKPAGARGYHLIMDPEVRKRRVLFEE